jgi:hypothetical protein
VLEEIFLGAFHHFPPNFWFPSLVVRVDMLVVFECLPVSIRLVNEEGVLICWIWIEVKPQRLSPLMLLGKPNILLDEFDEALALSPSDFDSKQFAKHIFSFKVKILLEILPTELKDDIVSLAIILSGSEINSLHNFLNPPICYDCSLCSAFSASGWEQ